MHRTAIGQIVAVHGCNDSMFETQMFNGLGDVCRLQRVEVHWLAFIDRTESAMPGASIAAGHECRGLICPAFKDVGTLGFLTNGMQTEAADKIEDSVLVARVAELDL